MEITFFAVISALLLFMFIGSGIIRFGIQPSYSSYSALWDQVMPMNNMNLWSVITCVCAFLVCPALFGVGLTGVWRFIGLLPSAYLVLSAFTPNWLTNKRQLRIHMIVTPLCFIGTFLWCLVAMHSFKVLVGVAIFIMTLALFSGTSRKANVFWMEMFMLSSVYLVLFLTLL